MSIPSATMAERDDHDCSISSLASYFAGCQHEHIIELREMRANVVAALNEAQMAFNYVASNPDDEMAAADSDFARDGLQGIVYRYLAKTNDISKLGELDNAYDLWAYSANSLKTVRSKWTKMKFFATDLYSDNFPTTEEILRYRQRAPHKLGVDAEAVDETLQRVNLNDLNQGGLGGASERRDVRPTHHSSMCGTTQEPVHEQLHQHHQQPPVFQQARQQHHQQQCQVKGDWIAKAANGDGEVVRQVGGDQERSEGVGGGHRHQQPPQKRPTDTDHHRPQTTQVHRHHSNHHPPPPPPSPLTRRQMGAQAARQGLAHQPLSDGAIEKFLAASHADNFIRWREIGYKNLEKARPRTPHTSLTPTDYIILKRRFLEAANNKGITEMDMLLELPHWFSGPVADVIMTATIGVTAETAAVELEKCFERMDMIFQGELSMVGALLDGIASAPPIATHDYKAHFLLYAELLKAEKIARVCGEEEMCHRENRIRDILNNRIPHLADKFWTEDFESKQDGRGDYNYHNLVELVSRWAIIKRYQAPPEEDSTIHDQHQPNGLCEICSHPHATSQCPILMDVSVDSRVDILSKRELCYHCLEKGHTAKYCNNKPTCQMCGRVHATILHGRNFNQ